MRCSSQNFFALLIIYLDLVKNENYVTCSYIFDQLASLSMDTAQTVDEL